MDVSPMVVQGKADTLAAHYQQNQELVDKLEVPAAIVEIFPPITTPDVIMFVVRSGEKGPSFVQLAISEDQLINLIKTYYREVGQFARHGDIGQRWQDLAVPLLKDLSRYLEGVELVYLIPHGMLAYLPLHAFPIEGSCFIERFAIAYSPSPSLLKEVVERSAARETQQPLKALVVGNPTLDLEHTEKEAVQVADFFGATPYLRGKATKFRINSELPDKDLIHLACHGFFHSSEPWLSTILLAGKRGLQVADIEAVNLRADLVTLSACESGLHDVYSKREPIGLPEVFLRAGASSVLGTMWPVADESTGELMIDFYSRLYDVTGHKVYTKAKALQEAVRTMRKKKAHPFYWAPFVLHGHWQ